ncbi:MAG: DNA polymerase/3'-5' exonuclease PolX [Elusimicrobia bacterium]|nr:DNA polymerase/3'-5' exonuclease PolX [Elusimicrobiota bacterium]
MTNAEVAALLSETAVLLELAGENPFRTRAYERAAMAVAGSSRPVCELSEKELLEIPGVGASIAAHIREAAGCGAFGDLRRLRERFPAGLLELLRVPGLGPKRARFLFDAAGVKDLESLKAACEAGKLKGLKGFGDKIIANILEGLSFAEVKPRLLNWEARGLARELVAALKRMGGVGAVEAAGSLRRGRETVGDIDILAASADGAKVTEAFVHLPQVLKVLGVGETKASVLLAAAPTRGAAGVQCDLRVVPAASFGAALQYFTGSKDHNVALRQWALKRHLTVNEYGVFKLGDKEQKQPVAGRTEAEVYEALGLAYIPPELRENRGEIEAAAAGKLPRLVTLSDIRGDLHNHSNHTDGRHSLEEMARAAKERGWEWVALGDHSRSLTVARGLDEKRLRASFKELEGLRAKVKGIELFRSMEVDILEDGRMDYPDDVLDEIDVVVASVHSRFKQPLEQMTARLCRAAANRRVDVMGHLSGRLLNKRPGYAFDPERVLKAAAGAGTACEINGQPDRQDLDDVSARRVRELGGALALTTDAHSTSEFQFMEMAVTVARRAWLEPKDLLNCKSAKELREWLAARAAKP